MIYPAYEKYKDSGVPWLGQVPVGWTITRLNEAAKIKTSNVDKKTEEGEEPVRLCNYVDIYYNEKITSKIEFMMASATIAEINKFRLYKGDVVLTKDSESPSDIGIPAFIDEDIEDLVCGYHLAVLKSIADKTWGAYLYYAIKSRPSAAQFEVLANGITRFGLSHDDLKSILFALPSFPEQKAIADFLDVKTAEIDALIAKKQELLKLLSEQRTALITNAVTKGLNPNARMKDSGIDWLGPIPAHWEMKRLRFTLSTNPKKSKITASPETVVSFVPMDAVGEYGGLRLDIEKPMDEIGDGYTYFAENDVVVAKITPCFENGKGALAKGLSNGIAFGTTELHVLRASEQIKPTYLFLLTNTYPFRRIGEAEMYGAGGQKRVPEDFIKDFRIGIPPDDEQQEILDYVDRKLKHMGAVTDKTMAAIDRLKEYRTALITNAVTGKIDVRGFQLETVQSADVIALPSRNRQSTPAFRRAVFAAKIADRMIGQPTFGRVKFQKILHLSEAHLGIEEIQGNYQRHAAGPHDARMMKSVEGQLQRQGWLIVEQRNANAKVVYKKTNKTDQYLPYFRNYWRDREAEIGEFLDLFSKMNTQQTEIVSTLYAAWNDLLIEARSATDDQIISEVLNRWHDDKRNIAETRWRSALDWMRSKGFVPHGAGSRTKSDGQA